MGRRLNIVVDDDVPNLLRHLAGGERRQGTYLSGLIRLLATHTPAYALPLDPADRQEIVEHSATLAAQLRAFAQRLEGLPPTSCAVSPGPRNTGLFLSTPLVAVAAPLSNQSQIPQRDYPAADRGHREDLDSALAVALDSL